MPIEPAAAEEDLAQAMTGDTGAGGDMNRHAERKVDQMENEMSEG